MEVLFKEVWYSGEGRFRKGVQDVPDHLLDQVPSTAIKLGQFEKKPEPVVEQPGQSLRDYDGERAASDEYSRIIEEANAAADQYQLATDPAMKLIKRLSLKLEDISGTGKFGKVTLTDVENYLKEGTN